MHMSNVKCDRLSVLEQVCKDIRLVRISSLYQCPSRLRDTHSLILLGASTGAAHKCGGRRSAHHNVWATPAPTRHTIFNRIARWGHSCECWISKAKTSGGVWRSVENLQHRARSNSVERDPRIAHVFRTFVARQCQCLPLLSPPHTQHANTPYREAGRQVGVAEGENRSSRWTQGQRPPPLNELEAEGVIAPSEAHSLLSLTQRHIALTVFNRDGRAGSERESGEEILWGCGVTTFRPQPFITHQ